MQKNFDEKFNISLLPLKEQEASQLNAIELAYLGDTIYDLYVRSFLVKNDMGIISTTKLINKLSQDNKECTLAQDLLRVLNENLDEMKAFL